MRVADTLVWPLARKISLEFSQFALGRKSVDHWPHKVPEVNTSKLYRSQRQHTILQNCVLAIYVQGRVSFLGKLPSQRQVYMKSTTVIKIAAHPEQS